MSSVNEIPAIKPPKKRASKSQMGEEGSNIIQCCDVIRTHHGDHLKGQLNSPTDLLLRHSPAHRMAQISPKKKSDLSDGKNRLKSSENDTDPDAVSEKSALNDTKSLDSYITMTGTIKRGKKAGQSVDVRLNMSREELENLEANIKKPKSKNTQWSIRRGVHIILFSILCCPIAAFLSGSYSFYLGTLTWYNIYLLYNEERTIWHKIFICPLLLFLYPFLIVIFIICLAIYSAFSQISWNFDKWKAEFMDLEKGFFGWICSTVGLDECAPYEVVILNDTPCEGVKVPDNDTAL